MIQLEEMSIERAANTTSNLVNLGLKISIHKASGTIIFNI